MCFKIPPRFGDQTFAMNFAAAFDEYFRPGGCGAAGKDVLQHDCHRAS